MLPAHALEWRLHELTDGARNGEGLAALARSEALALAARHHAVEMAELGYFSHTSPTAGNATPSRRVANAGGPMAQVGENLASLPRMTLDFAERVVDGWMDSPGHRQNMLRPSWTHVGFGLHEHGDGRVYVVQVFAEDPNPLHFAHAAPGSTTSLSLRFMVTNDATGFIVLARGAEGGQRVPVTAGQTITVTVDGVSADAPTHIRLAWGRDGDGGVIGQESGWFDPLTSRITTDYRSAAASSRIESYAASAGAARDIVVQLAFERDASDLSVVIDRREVPLSVLGTNVRFSLPGGSEGVPIAVGSARDDSTLTLLQRFTVVNRSGTLVVVPLAP